MPDSILRQDIIEELDYEPSIDATNIGVAVKDGTVTLTGWVRNFSEKRMAETVVKRMKGVRAIAQEIEVRPVGSHVTADDEIARRVSEALRWSNTVPSDAIKATVEDGYVTLTGSLSWNYERSASEAAVRDFVGVRGVLNQIKIIPTVKAADVQRRINEALRRDAELEAERIQVHVDDRKVTLEGKVRTWAEREAAERAAWAAPGVTQIVDHLQVGT